MGYTHYWKFKKLTKWVTTANKTELAYQRAIRQCAKIVRAYSAVNGGLAGYTAHTKPGQYGGLNVNGAGANGHEPFELPEHFTDNFSDTSAFGFCKTARKPYDTVVVACLIVLKHYLADAITVSSDGERHEWADGLQLATRVLSLKSLTIPNSIQTRGGIYAVR